MKTSALAALAALLSSPLAAAGEPTLAPGAVAPAPPAVAPPAPAVLEPAVLLGAIDVLLTADGMARSGLTEDYALGVLGDVTARRYLRARAIAALGIFRSARGRAAVESAARGDADGEIRIQAVLSLARAFGPVAPMEIDAVLAEVARSAPAELLTLVTAERARLAAAR